MNLEKAVRNSGIVVGLMFWVFTMIAVVTQETLYALLAIGIAIKWLAYVVREKNT